jgi:hypothetical protein
MAEALPVCMYTKEPNGPVPHINALVDELRPIGYGGKIPVVYLWGDGTDATFLDNVNHVLSDTVSFDGGRTWIAADVPVLVVSGDHATNLAISASRAKDSVNPKNIVTTIAYLDEDTDTTKTQAQRNWCGCTMKREDAPVTEYLRLLRKCYPTTLEKVGVLYNPKDRSVDYTTLVNSWPADLIRVELQITSPAALPGLLDDNSAKIDSLIDIGGWIQWDSRSLITAKAIQYKWPLISPAIQYSMARGLLSYGPDVLPMYRQAADHIPFLRGEGPVQACKRSFNAPSLAFKLYINERTEQLIEKPVDPDVKKDTVNVKLVWF